MIDKRLSEKEKKAVRNQFEKKGEVYVTCECEIIDPDLYDEYYDDFVEFKIKVGREKTAEEFEKVIIEICNCVEEEVDKAAYRNGSLW